MIERALKNGLALILCQRTISMYICVCERTNKICICAVYFCQKFVKHLQKFAKIYCQKSNFRPQPNAFLFYSGNLAVSMMVTSFAVAAFDANFKSLCYNQILKQCDRNHLLFLLLYEHFN